MLKMFDPTILARETVRAVVNRRPLPIVSTAIGAQWLEPGGAFVCVKKHGALRGCIGTVAPTTPSLAEEIIQNAVGSATLDHRFAPITSRELEDLTFSVDVLGTPEPVASLDELDPKKFGVIVETQDKRGLLLPDHEGVDTVEDQVAIAREKAGIADREPVALQRFTVTRY